MSVEKSLLEVQRSLGRIEGKLDGLAERVEDDRDYLYRVSARVGTLEHDKSRRKGAVAVVSAAVSAMVALLVGVVKATLFS